MCTRELLSFGSLSWVSSILAVSPLNSVMSQDEKKCQSLGVLGQGKVNCALGALGLAALDPFRVLPEWDLETDVARDPEGYFEISVM